MPIVERRKTAFSPELGEWMLRHKTQLPARGDDVDQVNAIFTALKLATKVINLEMRKAYSYRLGEIKPEADLIPFADQRFTDALRNRRVVAGMASSHGYKFVSFEGCENLQYVINVHPLDEVSGSGFNNVSINVPVGSVFAIYRRVTPLGEPVARQDFLQPGNKIVMAGYMLYGSSTMLVYSTGHGTNGFTLDPSLGTWNLSHPNMKIPQDGPSVSEASSNPLPAAPTTFNQSACTSCVFNGYARCTSCY